MHYVTLTPANRAAVIVTNRSKKDYIHLSARGASNRDGVYIFNNSVMENKTLGPGESWTFYTLKGTGRKLVLYKTTDPSKEISYRCWVGKTFVNETGFYSFGRPKVPYRTWNKPDKPLLEKLIDWKEVFKK